ncbi:hypothetical protein LTR05_005564 [Lithohypha guttulata]|uniref:BZIP domain-containing protein n=1 Tax=Lithohypha guttulata TaxID=1690604 RepID=A0AAN7SYD6_9EURO|nr:hypothetical protein LTR05_005564 [Lithohypha guttulata]
MESEQFDLTLQPTWTADGFLAAGFSALGTALDASYASPSCPTNSAVSIAFSMPSIELQDSMLGLHDFYETKSLNTRYGSLDGGHPGASILVPLIRTRSLTDDARESAKERRRTQNRRAQRAYRQRKEQIMKDQETEIESLKLQLAKEKRLTLALARVIEFLKERLKTVQKSSPTANEEAAVS